MNLLATMQVNEALTWLNAPARWGSLPDSGLRIFAPAKTDWFRDPAGHVPSGNAPYLYLAVEGDFVAQAHACPAFASTYDAGALMVYINEAHWAKLCFEATDFGTHAAVSVVTNGVSDDANGVDLTVPGLWLQVVRKGNVFAQHYSLDGSNWRMVRYFGLPAPQSIRVGLVAQSPVGPGTHVDFYWFSVESRSVDNMRAGV